MTNKVVPFNPLEKENLAASVLQALLEKNTVSMSNLHRFNGAGIYAIYYFGDFAPYQAIASANRIAPDQPTVPIYVGKAVPAGGRRGASLTGGSKSTVLHSRLSDHADSIRASNLNLDDFKCRSLVVDDVWIPLTESLLISRFHPLWNSLVDGFGNHDPGSGRYQGLRPRWDVLHPGRAWAGRCREREETKEDIERDVRTFLRTHFPL